MTADLQKSTREREAFYYRDAINKTQNEALHMVNKLKGKKCSK